MPLPNFIIIGAAKAGTTALYHYFAEHPDVFMSPVKETNFFAYGLDSQGHLLYGDPGLHEFPIKTLSEYERLFAGAGNARAVGEASPIYLECPQAAERIYKLLPGVRLICSLRNPVDRAYSDYQMYLRHRGRSLDPVRDLSPGASWAGPDSHFVRIGSYHEQLSRYFGLFPREQIHVILFDDLKRDAREVLRELYRFVGVEPDFTPDLSTPHARGGLPASRLLESVFRSRFVTRALRPWIPAQAASWVRRLRGKNMRSAPTLPLALRQELTAHFSEDIARTAQLIERNLDQWRHPSADRI